eukprot:CAMPEP_0181311364 /NCGR_PEP_ID=MMETSP1101-20121128/13094_1 /TAXON_ID=46948 /ORGANISM="Rhodomonas abbreviata, Strain Caron Lab Isolate" /LENGTH=350 /DNA_ID=CAMNT_0023418083 /DNA_START=181 /DNA_END=1230 /DNA_ORIENTATION=+
MSAPEAMPGTLPGETVSESDANNPTLPAGSSKRQRVNSGKSNSSQLAEIPGFLDDYTADDLEEELQDGVFWEREGRSSEEPENQSDAKPRRVCDDINLLATRGKSITFETTTKHFTVLDGALFENEYKELKAARSAKNAQERIFAQMYRTYVIVQGERWAATGTVFAAKSKTTPLPSAPPPAPQQQTSKSPTDIIPGDSVSVWLDDEKSGQRVQCTLQHFLDTTGLGKLYAATATNKKRGRDEEEGGEGADAMEGVQSGVPLQWMHEQLDQPLCQGDVGEVLGGVWSATSKGDQAYFFRRMEGVPRFANGDIVGLVGGRLVESEEVEAKGGLYMVVSDLNAKWKGEPLPA